MIGVKFCPHPRCTDITLKRLSFRQRNILRSSERLLKENNKDTVKQQQQSSGNDKMQAFW